MDRAFPTLHDPEISSYTSTGIVSTVHPIERLRYVARAGSAPDSFLVAESVPALAAFSHDPNAMLVALKGLITRQPESPGLLGLAAHMVHSLDPVSAGWAFADDLHADRTADIAETLAIAESGGTDVIDSVASGVDADSGALTMLCPPGTTAWIGKARSEGRSVAVVTPKGSRLPPLLWARFVSKHDRIQTGVGESVAGELELIDAALFDDAVGNSGVTPLAEWEADSPDVAEVARF